MRRGCRVARGSAARGEGPLMIVPSGAVRVLVATRPVDFRKSIDGVTSARHVFTAELYDTTTIGIQLRVIGIM